MNEDENEQIPQPEAASTEPVIVTPSPAAESTATPAAEPTATFAAAGHTVAQDPLAAEATSYKTEAQLEAEAAKSSPNAKKKSGFWPAFAGGCVGAVVLLALFMALWQFTPVFNGVKGSTGSTNNGTITINGNTEASTAEAVSAKCLNSVVTVYVYSSNSSWNQYFGGSSSSSSSSPSSLGSGVVIANEGDTYYILTNYHVVENSSKFTVKVGDKSYDAKSVGSDEKSDLAVISIKASGLTVMEVADSSKVNIGAWCMAIGSPYGYEQTVTTGIVSALYRSDVLTSESGNTIYTDMIQTDAAINPGNSGGALVDAEGKLIGINTYISSSSGSYAGLGFAIPSNEAKEIADALVSGKKVSHAFLGASLTNSTDPAGAGLTTVYKNTSASTAGLKAGDVITKFGDATISNGSDLTVAVSSHKVGDEVEVTYSRSGKTATCKVKLGDSDDSSNEVDSTVESSNSSNGSNGNGGSGSSGNGYGFDLGDLFGSGSGSFWE